ncbi:hypothetical protein [Lentzea sp. NBRC 102530]|uniref:hypothetical protein n=1 Tax=Lentzea sp. NBRC 102530 TaxID=3032201 RepID=UPI0024A51412|nr:hypothetical protein [Lentzea sp. NBRC 102530]GLY54861.1 hypothetical protein Lesp01_85160 [Lentzea sp. NBRC 102530]
MSTTNPHPRFGKHGKPKPETLAQIADVTAWAAAQTTPFTTMEAFRACQQSNGYKASYATTYNTLRELRDQKLLHQVNAADAHTHLYLHIDQIEGQAAKAGDGRG